MRPALGTYEWTEQYDGKMNFREKMRMARWLVGAQVRELWEKSVFRKSWRKQRLQHVDLDAIQLPDTALVQEATAYVADKYSVEMLRHVYRCYYWAGLLAQFDGLRFDEELFFMADLFHDIVLTDEHIDKARHCCFTKPGARMAQQFVAERGWEATKAMRVYECISMHLNPYISKERGAETHLLGAAATFDLMGLQFHKIPEAIILRVLDRHSRVGIEAEILRLTGKDLHPKGTRAAFYNSLGPERIMKLSPMTKPKYNF